MRLYLFSGFLAWNTEGNVSSRTESLSFPLSGNNDAASLTWVQAEMELRWVEEAQKQSVHFHHCHYAFKTENTFKLLSK